MRLIDADPFGVIFLQGKSEEFIEGVNFILDKIYEAPTIEERPHGEWEYTGCVNDELQPEFCCSICNFSTYSRQFNFCPKCGADMRKEGDRNDNL